MSDLVSRAALLDEYDKRHVGPPGGARKLIEEAHAVDAVPVVRCKDCKYWERGDCYRLELSRPDDFCSYGEREVNAG